MLIDVSSFSISLPRLQNQSPRKLMLPVGRRGGTAGVLQVTVNISYTLHAVDYTSGKRE